VIHPLARWRVVPLSHAVLESAKSFSGWMNHGGVSGVRCGEPGQGKVLPGMHCAPGTGCRAPRGAQARPVIEARLSGLSDEQSG